MDKIENHIMAIYEDIQKQLPKMDTLTFAATTYDTGKTKLYGFLHVDGGCASFFSILELKNIIQEKIKKKRIREILYRNFKGVL